jgi:hypothetical protein
MESRQVQGRGGRLESESPETASESLFLYRVNLWIEFGIFGETRGLNALNGDQRYLNSCVPEFHRIYDTIPMRRLPSSRSAHYSRIYRRATAPGRRAHRWRDKCAARIRNFFLHSEEIESAVRVSSHTHEKSKVTGRAALCYPPSYTPPPPEAL